MARRYIESPLSSSIIGDEFDEGDVIVMDRGEEDLTFNTFTAA